MALLRFRQSSVARVSSLLALLVCAAVPAAAQHAFEVLFDFPQRPSGPAGTLVRGPDGSLYGTVTSDDPYPFHGSSTQWGAIYRLTPDGAGGYTYRQLHQFSETDGSMPAGLIQGPDGHLYGTTIFGGPSHMWARSSG